MFVHYSKKFLDRMLALKIGCFHSHHWSKLQKCWCCDLCETGGYFGIEQEVINHINEKHFGIKVIKN